jgi:hypothetical protein
MVAGSRLLLLCWLLRMSSVHASCHERPTGFEFCCPGQYWTAGWVRTCHNCQGQGEYSDGKAQNACPKCNYDRCNVANTYTVAACNHEHDTICASCTICNTDTQYEISPCINANRLCSTTTTCNNDNYASEAPTPTSDRVCAQCTACASWQYETLECSQDTNWGCTYCTECAPWQYETLACSQGTNRECTNLTTCVIGQTYQTTVATATVDRICSNCTPCANDTKVGNLMNSG